MTRLNVQNLVEFSRHMKPQCRWKRLALGRHYRHPTAIGKRQFQLVAIPVNLSTTQNRHHLKSLHFANSLHRIHHLLLLECQLIRIAQMLPFAAATRAKIRTRRIHPQRRFFMKLDDFALHEVLFLLHDLHVHHIARRGILHKNYLTVVTGNTMTFSRSRFNGQFLEQSKLFYFSSHKGLMSLLHLRQQLQKLIGGQISCL